MKLTVNEYAKEFKTSVQSVYQRIKRGSLKSIEENGIKYVLLDKESVKPSLNPNIENEFKEVFKVIKRLQKQIKDKDKEIKRLTKKIAECNGTKENVLLQYIEEIKTIKKLESPIIQDDDVIEIKEKKKSKKKDKKKKKGKK